MNRYAAALLKVVAYTVATLVILLAVAVGLLRLMLPELPQYRDEIQARASEAIGLDVQFTRLDARWRLSGPELIFHGVTLSDTASGDIVLNADEVNVGAAFLRMLRERRITIGRIGIVGTSVSVERSADGKLSVQGRAAGGSEAVSAGTVPDDIRITLADVDISYSDPRVRDGPISVTLDTLAWARRGSKQELEAELDPGAELGGALTLAARTEGRDDQWDVYLDATALDLESIASILPREWPAPRAGIADLEVWASVRGTRLRRATANLQVEGMLPNTEEALLPYEVQARFEWALRDGGWLGAIDGLRIRRGESIRPESFIRVAATSDEHGAISDLEIETGYLNMVDLKPLASLAPPSIRAAVKDYDPSGEIVSLKLRAEDLDQRPLKYAVEAELREAGIAAYGGIPGVRGITGGLRADESNGRLVLDSRALVVDMPSVFSAPLVFTRADSTIVWRGSDEEISVLCDRLILADEWLLTESSFELELPMGEGEASPRLDLTAEWRLSDIGRVPRYLPVRVMPRGLVEWFEKAMVAGRAEAGSLIFDGALADFPFDDGGGEFSADVRIRDATLRFALQWPEIEGLDAAVKLEGMRLSSTENSAVTMGNTIRDAYVAIEDLRQGLLEIRGSGGGPLDRFVAYAESSPISGLFGGRLSDVSAGGQGRIGLEVDIPVTRIDDYEVRAEIATDDGRFSLAGFPHPLESVSGSVMVTRAGASGQDLKATFLGSPMLMDVLPATDADSGVVAIVVAESRVTADALIDTVGVPLRDELSGEAAYLATVRFPRAGQTAGPPVTIRLESDLEGMGLSLPPPARKAAAGDWPFSLEFGFPAEGRLAVTGFYGQSAKWILDLSKTSGAWDLERGNIHFGPGLATRPTGAGLHFTGALDSLRLGDWLERATDAEGGGIGRLIRSADVAIDDLYAFGQRVREVGLELERNARDWMVQVDSATVSGSIIVPTDLDSGRSLVLDMDRLYLVEADPQADEPGEPTGLPPLSVRTGEFRLGERSFGAVEADFAKTEAGLESENLSARSDTFTFVGAASWRTDLSDPAGERSALSGELNSNDVETTLSQLGYYPGIDATSGFAGIDLSISGPPREDFLSELDGEVRMSIEDGRLDEVEPGAGRVFGLLSVAALPRRLALDFRDVFDKGLSFDEITGTFRIVNGDAYTCDLTLKSSVADIGVVGRAGLAQRDYNQTALVGANVGSTLPAVGAVVAGPQAAAALLLFSQIFKKPLQELAQAYYQVTGDFDDPTVERTDARRFAATSELAGCLSEAS